MPPKAKKGSPKKILSSSRFRCVDVKKRVSIRDCFKANDLPFDTGRGFYQLTKPEIIQQNKEVVVRRKSDGKFVSGDAVSPLSFIVPVVYSQEMVITINYYYDYGLVFVESPFTVHTIGQFNLAEL